MAVPFDIDRLEVTGVPSPVASGVVTSHAWGIGQFDISWNGTLVYLPGVPEDIFPKTLWVDRSGHVEPFELSRDFRQLRFSPDGRRIAFRESKGNDDIWTYDVVRGTMTRVTSRWDNVFPVWMLDGNSILYSVLSPGPGLVRKAADGTGNEEVILEPDATFLPGSVSPDGQNVTGTPEGDIWILPLTEELDPRVFIESPFAESQPRFSRMASGSRTYPTSRGGRRSTCSRFRALVVVSRSRRVVGVTRCGAGTARSCSFSVTTSFFPWQLRQTRRSAREQRLSYLSDLT